MIRAARLAAIAAAVWLGGVVGGGQTRSAREIREDAYRANNLGVALLEQFKFEEAAAAFREALRLDANLAIAHLNLSIALVQASDLIAARAEATTADRLMADAPQPPYVLGLIARNENRDDEAVALFERVLRLDPHDVGTAINLAQIRIQDRQYADAVTLLRPAVADEPFNVTAAYNLGVALTRSGQRDEGQQMMERSQALRATGYGTTLSNAYLEQGRYAEALASTGAEPDLVDAATPAVSYAPAVIRPADSASASAATVVPTPFGREFSEADLTGDGPRRLAASLGGALTVFDFDRDGDLDVFVADAGGQRLLRNDGGGRFTDVTAAARLGDGPAASVAVGCIAGDFDNDGVPDLFVLRYGTSSLYRNDGEGHFVDVTSTAAVGAFPFLPGAAAFVDLDHDGDLDLVVAGLADLDRSRAMARDRSLVFPRDFAPAPVVVLRNNGNGTFTSIAREAKIDVSVHALAVVPTDFDNRRDIDLLIVGHDEPPVLLKNLRDGTFGDVASQVGLSGIAAPFSAVAVADVNKDDFPDFFFGRADGAGVFALSDGRGRFTTMPAPESSRGAIVSQFLDYDNDGLLDLLTWSSDGPHLARNVGRSWVDVTATAFAAARPAVSSARAFAAADLDRRGHDDLIVGSADGALAGWRATGVSNRSVRVQLTGRVSNRSSLGTKVQVRAGSLSQRLELSASTPAVAPADLVFGLGPRPGADVVRVLWPSGILQAEFSGSSDAAAPAPVTPTPLPPSVGVEELNRKPSSCPFLYTWNGERFEFVTDFMGGGEMGYWEGPGEYNRADPVEFVRIRDDQLRARDGQYELRVTNELEETLYVDRLQLLAVSHPRDVEIFPNEGMTDPPKSFRLFAVKGGRVPATVSDDRGQDVTSRVAALDREYADGFALESIRGYAAMHTLDIDLGVVPSRPVLLLTGWTDYAFSSDNVAAHQAGLAMSPPALQVQDRSGAWRTAVADIGIPVGRPQTIVVDLESILQPHEHAVRLVTNMRIYWDRILVGSAIASDSLPRTALRMTSAELRERGFSAEVLPGGHEPIEYDYSRVTQDSPWKTMTGRYTRVGDVAPLLARTDDMFVIGRPGDEIALTFAAPSRPLRPGWRQTFLLLADGFSKEMDINSASPDRVEPLPFHRMTRYPYGGKERYPVTAAHEQYRAQYNTRIVATPWPSLGARSIEGAVTGR